jgi:hypothetical protein
MNLELFNFLIKEKTSPLLLKIMEVPSSPLNLVGIPLPI